MIPHLRVQYKGLESSSQNIRIGLRCALLCFTVKEPWYLIDSKEYWYLSYELERLLNMIQVVLKVSPSTDYMDLKTEPYNHPKHSRASSRIERFQEASVGRTLYHQFQLLVNFLPMANVIKTVCFQRRTETVLPIIMNTHYRDLLPRHTYGVWESQRENQQKRQTS